MQGILVIDKPAGFTSFDVVAKLRGICQTRKIGHSGTLDPMATGVLPVFIGTAARAVDMQQNHNKRYVAQLLLGTRTDTGDVTGAVLETADVPPGITAEAVRGVLPQFLGESEQLPPMYSAVKVNGQPLYKAARAGKTVERKPRKITIHSLTLLESPAPNVYTLDVLCGKGTYVRVLLEEIAAALGTVGTMQALRRTEAGVYTLAHAHTLDEVQQAKDGGTLDALLTPVDSVFAHLPALEVDETVAARLLNGAPTSRFKAKDGRFRAYAQGAFLGVCTIARQELRMEKSFAERV